MPGELIVCLNGVFGIGLLRVTWPRILGKRIFRIYVKSKRFRNVWCALLGRQN